MKHFLGPSPLRSKGSPHPLRTPTCQKFFDPRGEPLAAHGPTAAHIAQPGVGETYAPPHWAPMRRELLRSAPRSHSFPPRGGPLAKFGPMAAHPTHPGDGETYEHTDGAPMRRELLRSDPQPHAFPPRGEPLAKFGPTDAHPIHPRGRKYLFPKWLGAQALGGFKDSKTLSRFPF